MAWQILCSSTRCCWGILEYHGNESLLASLEAVLGFARIMAWKGTHPVVELVTTTERTGVKLTQEAMDCVEAQLKRLSHCTFPSVTVAWKSAVWTSSSVQTVPRRLPGT